MVAEAVSARDRAKEEKAAMALRISHMEEEREGKSAAGGLFSGQTLMNPEVVFMCTCLPNAHLICLENPHHVLHLCGFQLFLHYSSLLSDTETGTVVVLLLASSLLV